MPPTTSMYVLSTRRQLHAVQQLPRNRQILPSGRSRAFFLQSHLRVPQRFPPQIRSSERWRCSLICKVSFSTSSLCKTDHGNPNKQRQSAAPVAEKQNGQKPPPKSPLASLKSKLPTLHHENIYTLPNILTFSRLLSTPVLGYLILHNQPLPAFALFLYAGISDLLDGWIARRWNLQTVVGSVVDPMADKALMTTLVSCLAINGSLSLPIAALILGRDVSLAIAAIYFRYASLPPPKTMARYWDFSLPSAEVHPTGISKFNTFLQLGLIGTTMCVSLLHDPVATQSAAGGLLLSVQDILGGPQGVETMVKGMSGIVAGTTVYSGLSYVWTKDAVKILGDDEALKKRQGFRGRMIIAGTFGSVIALATALWWKELQKDEGEEEETAANK